MTTTDSAAEAAESPVTRAAPAGNNGAPDVDSDPARDDTEGQDWSDEGGATPAGPATTTPSG